MQLNSLDFMFFLSFICLFYFMVPDKIKNIVLLTASYVFYARGENSCSYTFSCFSVQRITIKMDCQPTTSTALPKSGISFF